MTHLVTQHNRPVTTIGRFVIAWHGLMERCALNALSAVNGGSVKNGATCGRSYSRRFVLVVCAVAVWEAVLAAEEVASSGGVAKKVAARVAALRDDRSLAGYAVINESPFVVIGNERPDVVAQRARTTVRWTAQQFQTVYAQGAPQEMVEVWLLRDAVSFDAISQRRWHLKPISPFGYFLPSERIVVVQLEHGAGTLVHEMFHALMNQDFPQCPPWFQEGLAALYEESTTRQGQIWGLPNWRLRGLQRRIIAEELPSFAQLFQMSREDFYGAAAPATCAQARYLCLYLQQHQRLTPFYREFRRDVALDPTGLHTLQRVAQVTDLLDFQRQWQEYVMMLEVP